MKLHRPDDHYSRMPKNPGIGAWSLDLLGSLAVGAWCFSGAWMLVFGAFLALGGWCLVF